MKEFIIKFVRWSYAVFTFIIFFMWVLLLIHNCIGPLNSDNYSRMEHLLYALFLPASWMSIRKKFYVCHRINLCVIPDIVIYISLFDILLKALPEGIGVWPTYFIALLVYKLIHCVILRFA